MCGQVIGVPTGVRLSTPARRLGAACLDTVLWIVTLGIGYLVWDLIVFSDGRTPAKQLLGMRVVKAGEGRAATWGTMALRELVLKGLLFGIVGFFFFGFPYLIAAAFVLSATRQALWDRMINTVVVNDKAGALG
jgi:uncharacterized RDD family membrane protein YckC